MSTVKVYAIALGLVFSSYGCSKKAKPTVVHGEEKPLAFQDVPQVQDADFDPDLVIIDKDWLLNQSFSLSISAHDGNLTRQTFNALQGKLVRFEISAGRLYVLERPEGVSNHSHYPDLIITSFPIQKVNPSKTKLQIDFSSPDDKKFVSNLLGESGSWDTTSIRATTPALAKCSSESLAKFNCLTGTTDLAIRYNMRVVTSEKSGEETVVTSNGHVFYLGFSPTTAVDPSSSTLKIEDARKKMFSSGAVDDASGRSDLTPYFLTDDILGTPNGSTQESFQAVRRYDTSKPIEFILSEDTPKSMIDVVKSAVNSYGRAFQVMNIPNAGIVAYTADEFKAKHPEFTVIEAADPRISVIEWNNDGTIGSAWATAAAHPFTGIVKSADVFMTGAMWAMAGCRYQVLQTTVVEEKGSKLYTSPEVLEAATQKCEKILADLGVINQNSIATLTQDARSSSNSQSPYEALDSLDFKASQNLSTGAKRPKSGIDCIQDIQTTFSDLGGPIPEGLAQISPELAAKSMVRAVVIHELGHTFGLRHNFIASQSPAKIRTPVKTLENTDSIMDYVLYGFGIVEHSKALETTDGYIENPGLGVYDLIALAVAYNGDLSQITVDKPTQFCTDEDTVDPLSQCQRYDFGKEIKQSIQFNVAKPIRKLQLSGLPEDVTSALNLIKNLGIEQGKLWLSFLNSYSKASQSLNEKKRLELLPEILNLGFGQTIQNTEPWWDEFKKIHGGSIPSLVENLSLDVSKFENEIVPLRKADRDIVIGTSLNGFISAAETILAKRPTTGEKSLAAVVPLGFSVAEMDLNLDRKLATMFLDKIMLSAGTRVEFKSATGIVQNLALKEDFFNHPFSMAKVIVDGVEYRFAGQTNLKNMEASAKALSLLANGYSSSPSALALSELEVRLQKISNALNRSDRSFAPLIRMIDLSETFSQSAAKISL